MTTTKEQQLKKFLDQPADKPFFVKLLIVTQTKLGRALLLFHKTAKLDLPTSGMIYSAKVEKGETPRQIIVRHLAQIKKTSQYRLLSVKTDGVVQNHHGQELPRFAILISLPYFPTAGRHFHVLDNAHMSWVQLDKAKKDLRRDLKTKPTPLIN